MSLRVCSVPGCPVLCQGGRCSEHAKASDKARGSRQERGYDKTHDRIRKRWAQRLSRRPYPCARCGEPILVGDPFALDHTDDRTGYLGPSHEHCNNAAGGRAAHQIND